MGSVEIIPSEVLAGCFRLNRPPLKHDRLGSQSKPAPGAVAYCKVLHVLCAQTLTAIPYHRVPYSTSITYKTRNIPSSHSMVHLNAHLDAQQRMNR
jgi:hypothetical protein